MVQAGRHAPGHVALPLLIGWALFAFGGAYLWTTIPLVAGAIVLAASVRPRIADCDTRALDVSIVLALLVGALQLVPLPAAVRLGLSPALATTDRALHFVAPAGAAQSTPLSLLSPLSVDPEASAWAIVLAIATALVFWSARAMFEHGAMRRTILAIAVCGLVAAATALAQHATAPRLLYWTWRPINRSATPYSPFVNRNDLAAWLIMAIPLAAGYMLARLELRRRQGVLNLESALDPTGIWLGGSICMMAAGLVASLSRSGLTAGTAAAATLVWLSRGRMKRSDRAWLAAGLAFVALTGVAYANLDALMTRVGETVVSGVGGRGAIWAITMSMIRDFWLSGVGVGAYQRAMSVYQPPHVFSFNHAHNEYLQILSEGGLALAIPTMVAVLAGARLLARRLRRDRTPIYWMRAGATSALVAIGVQSIWETGVIMPANGVLFALCAAVAMHRPAQKENGRSSIEKRPL